MRKSSTQFGNFHFKRGRCNTAYKITLRGVQGCTPTDFQLKKTLHERYYSVLNFSLSVLAKL